MVYFNGSWDLVARVIKVSIRIIMYSAQFEVVVTIITYQRPRSPSIASGLQVLLSGLYPIAHYFLGFQLRDVMGCISDRASPLNVRYGVAKAVGLRV